MTSTATQKNTVTDPYEEFVASKLADADAAVAALIAVVDGDDPQAGQAALPLLYVAQDTQGHWAKLLRSVRGS